MLKLSSFRLADHFGGKLHMGFIQIREKRNVLKVIFHFQRLVIYKNIEKKWAHTLGFPADMMAIFLDCFGDI